MKMWKILQPLVSTAPNPIRSPPKSMGRIFCFLNWNFLILNSPAAIEETITPPNRPIINKMSQANKEECVKMESNEEVLLKNVGIGKVFHLAKPTTINRPMTIPVTEDGHLLLKIFTDDSLRGSSAGSSFSL